MPFIKRRIRKRAREATRTLMISVASWSMGQMWASPENGLTVRVVLSSSTTWLMENPPSMTGTPRKRLGTIPENTGMKVEATTACKVPKCGLVPDQRPRYQDVYNKYRSHATPILLAYVDHLFLGHEVVDEDVLARVDGRNGYVQPPVAPDMDVVRQELKPGK